MMHTEWHHLISRRMPHKVYILLYKTLSMHCDRTSGQQSSAGWGLATPMMMSADQRSQLPHGCTDAVRHAAILCWEQLRSLQAIEASDNL